MLRTSTRLGLALGLAAALAPVAGADDDRTPKPRSFRPHKPAKPGMRFRGDLKALVKSLGLPKDKERKLLADLKRYRAQQEALEKAHAERVKQAAKQLAPLRKEREKRERDLKALRAKQRKTALVHADKVRTQPLVTEKQLRSWESHKLRRAVAHDYRRAKLTGAQQAKLNAMCDKEAKQLAAAAPGERAQIDRKTRERLTRGMHRLLTGEQRHTVEAGRLETNAMRAMQGIQLTAEQYARIRSMCSEAVRKLDLSKRGRADSPKAWNEFRAKRSTFAADLVGQIREKVLTRQQRKQADTPKPKDRDKGLKSDSGGNGKKAGK